MPQNTLRYFIWLFAVIAVILVLFWLISQWAIPAASPQSGLNFESTTTTVTASDLPGGSRLFENAAAGYRFSVPAGWYVERVGGTGIAAYPDYDPAAGVVPACKIEISALPNPRQSMLGDWLVSYLSQDPTADVSPAFQSAFQVSGRDAIRWSGSLNGVSTTAAYLDGRGVVLEVVPSAVETSSAEPEIGNEACMAAFELLIKNFSIL